MQEVLNWEEIRQEKTEKYGTEYKEWNGILVQLYKDRTHFLFELLQNAEDTGASKVSFILREDGFTVEHNGIPFTKEDVISITAVKSSKSGGKFIGKYIGKFGIGFKSVYAYTANPRIYSGRYAFEIRDFLFPYEIPPAALRTGLTRIEIPFNRAKNDIGAGATPAEEELREIRKTAFQEISRALLRQIDGTTLLFLHNIQSLEIQIQGCPHTVRIDKERRELDGVSEVKTRYVSVPQGGAVTTEAAYWIFSDQRERTAVAFLHDGNELRPIPNSRVFTFFPTDKESHQSFLLQAPFETTPARDNIVEDSDRNGRLIESLCALIRRAFLWLRDKGWLTVKTLNDAYPMYPYEKDAIFRRIYDSAVQTIADGEKILPTNAVGVYKSVTEILLPERAILGELFDDRDLRLLLGGLRKLWISRDIAKDANRKFRAFLTDNFHPPVVMWTNILEKLTPAFLERKEKTWFERLFPEISGFVTLHPLNVHEADGRKLPFVRLADGRHICAWEKGKPSAYLNNPESCPNRIHADFLSSPTICDFYQKNLGVQDYNAQRIALDEILPKYRTETGGASMPWAQHLSDLRVIREALRVSPYLAESVGAAFLLTDGETWRHPGDLHIPSGFGGKFIPEYRLVEGAVSLPFLSTRYERAADLDSAFFKRLGCADTLRKISLDRDDYLNLVRTYDENGAERARELQSRIFEKRRLDEDAWEQCALTYEGLPRILGRMDFNRSRELARFLERNLLNFSLRTTLTAGGVTEDVSTVMGLLLTGRAWLYRKDGACRPVRETRRSELNAVYERDCKRLLDILPFQEEDRALEEILSRIGNPQDRNTLKRLLEHPDELTQLTRAEQKRLERERKRDERGKLSDREKLEAELQKRGKAEAPQAPPEEYESVSNPERRRKKIETEFRESMDFRVKVPRTKLKYTFQDDASPEEKSTLAEWYQGGYCQICRTAIVKWDGRLHFQAVNFLDTSEFHARERATLDLCWNSLCLCPNCAAKYRYGPKDISTFVEQVRARTVEPGCDEAIPIRIGLQGKQETIHYAPKHFLALQAAINVFWKSEN